MTDALETSIRTAFAAFNDSDFEQFGTYSTDDLVETYPQSAEQLLGRDKQRAMHEAFPSPPTFTLRQIRHQGDLAVVEVDEAYSDGSLWKTAFILELREGQIASLTGYFGEPFAAPDWRKPFQVRP